MLHSRPATLWAIAKRPGGREAFRYHVADYAVATHQPLAGTVLVLRLTADTPARRLFSTRYAFSMRATADSCANRFARHDRGG
jgi:hypothetical protein